MEKNRLENQARVPLGRLLREFATFSANECCSNENNANSFVKCLLDWNNPQVNVGIYNILKSFATNLATKESVDDADGESVEACRKICDFMGW